MILFVVGPFFRRRRPRRAQDEMPMQPLIEVLLFWAFFGIGALCGSMAIALFVAGLALPGVAGGAVSLGCLAASVAMWRRLRQ